MVTVSDTAVAKRAASRRAWSFQLGFAMVLVASAVFLSLLSYGLKSRAICAGECVSWHATVPVLLVVGISAAVVLALMVGSVAMRGRPAGNRLSMVAAVLSFAVICALIVMSLPRLQLVFRAAEAVPPMAAVPIAAAALIALVLGAAMVIFWHGEPATDGVARSSLAAGAVLALVIVNALGVGAWYLGYSGRVIEATTAARVDVPAVPATLGPLRFTTQVTPDKQKSSRFVPTVVTAAGAGFVTEWDNQVTAYDAAGRERWHYRRHGSGYIRRVGAYDDGRSLVLQITDPTGPGTDYPVMVGLDAMTGEQRWMRADPGLEQAFEPEFRGDPARTTDHLVAGLGESWIGYDPGTGRQTWQIPNPMRCEFDPARSVNTEVAFANVETCGDGTTSRLRLVSVNPTTGAILLDKSLALAYDTADISDIKAFRAGTFGMMVHVSLRMTPTHPLRDSYTWINLRTGDIVDFGDPPQSFAVLDSVNGGDGAFLIAEYLDGDQRVSVHNADGSLRCSLPPDTALYAQNGPGQITPATAAWLGDQIAFADNEGRAQLRSVARADCAPASAAPLAQQVWQVVAAPGATLVVRSGSDGVYVDGYASN